jgi:Tol biopolymer transport system component
LSRSRWILLFLLLSTTPAFSQREPVLKQIGLPHSYYFREMYLPQLTTGPSAAAWMPDSSTLIYAMAGSLWRQKTGSTNAEQLTAGSGYDYQPDVSPDGNWVIYDSYDKDAVELWALDLRDHSTHQLTDAGDVNLEPRFSPDGKRVTFVSTSTTGHFHIFVANFSNGSLTNTKQLTSENASTLPRYYYSKFDHEISPVWSRDGEEILFISNRGHIHGTGGFWRMKAEPGAEPREIHYEETNWKARPDFSPDGKRVVYASYLSQSWHQLWLIPSNGGDAFPVSYGSYDNINPRWSPDGKQIAFISNRSGNTSLWTQTIPGGAQTELKIEQRNYLKPMGHLSVKVLGANGKPAPARIFLTAADGRAYAPRDAWMHADDNFDRKLGRFEPHYFQTRGTSEIDVPPGRVQIDVMKGFEYAFDQRSVEITAGRTAEITVQLKPFARPWNSTGQWTSGDVHVHMNYGGTYRNVPKHLVEQAEAENLPIVENLIVNKEQRIPDIAYFSTQQDPASTPQTLLFHGQEFHTSYWGHLGLLNLKHNFLLPDYVSYPNTAAASLYPANANVADLAHAQQGLVGYVHPLESVPDPVKDAALTYELPVDVALGKVDYIEVVGFADHKSAAEVWYRLLNCGFRLPTAAGTDAMENYASLRGPLGTNRVYVSVPKGPLAVAPWLEGIKKGRTFATNGPLIGFTLNGQTAGKEVKLPAAIKEVKFSASLRSIVALDHLQIVCNGHLVKDLPLTADRRTADFAGTIPAQTGWCVLRGWNEKATYPVLDLYPYATTSPVYVSVEGMKPPSAKQEAVYFMAWIDRMTAAADKNENWNTPEEKTTVLGMLKQARTVYEQLQ